MVAKLLLAVQETCQRAEADDSPTEIRGSLAQMYFEVRSGIGYEKTAAEYGAFPTDPYSHTPASGNARQPGMTGQVKEEILTRFGELGVRVERGAVRFQPLLLKRDEYLGRPELFHYFDVDGARQSRDLPTGGLAFTFCQVPVVYEADAQDSWIEIEYANGEPVRQAGNELDVAISAELFSRSGKVRGLRVGIPSRTLT